MRQIAEHKANRESVIEHSGYTFLYIRNLGAAPIEEIQHHHAVLIEAKDFDFVKMVVSQIRGNNNPEIYLKPIFLMKKAGGEFPVIEDITDGSIKEMTELDLIIPELERIITRTQDLTFANSVSFEAQVITKLISHLYVREQKELIPLPYALSGINYHYPFVSINFAQNEEHIALDILDIAKEEGILRAEYYDRVYLCSSCSGSRLSYREVCPKCSSSNTVPDDIIHHFPCGYVGPMQDFKNQIDDKLDCPKCNKRLRHIGVDYDKPSVIHECQNCNHKFQDYNVNAKCLSCGTDKSVEHLKSKEIKSYRLTKKGELAAVKGFVTTAKDIEEIVGTIKYDTFKTMLKYEIERLKQTEGHSNLCAIHISNSSQVYSKLGSELQRGLLKDLISVIRSNIRSSDIISFESSSTIVLSMNAIPYKIARKILGEMIVLLQELIKTGFDDLEVHFETHVVALDYGKTHELQLRELLTEFV